MKSNRKTAWSIPAIGPCAPARTLVAVERRDYDDWPSDLLLVRLQVTSSSAADARLGVLPEKMAERRQHMQRQHHRGDDADDRGAGHRLLHFGQSCRAATPATDEIGARFTAAICHRGHRK